jgi:UDP-3-O-acyl-N-acetylglucosamine deacetylase
MANNIPYMEGSAIKYLCRWRDKGGIQDLHKAQHFIARLIEEAMKEHEAKNSETIRVAGQQDLGRKSVDPERIAGRF